MRDVVIWTGPVAPFHVQGATVPGAKELFIGCCGDLTPPCQPPTCPTIGNQVMGSPASLLAKTGLSISELDDLFLAGFSAGGSILKRVLENSEYRAITTAVHAADATYTAAWVDQANRIPPYMPGYVAYGVDVVEGPGDKLFVATASPAANKTWATGVENLAAIRREIEARTGRKFAELTSFFGIEPAPEHVYQLGNVIFAEYPMEPLGHGHTTIAPQVWGKIILPWLAKGKGAVGVPGGLPSNGTENGKPSPVHPTKMIVHGITATDVLIGGIAAIAGYLLVSAAFRRVRT